eukprot:Selendium_serpulae@DN10316_c0_g1_i2.p1
MKLFNNSRRSDGEIVDKNCNENGSRGKGSNNVAVVGFDGDSWVASHSGPPNLGLLNQIMREAHDNISSSSMNQRRFENVFVGVEKGMLAWRHPRGQGFM